MPPKKGGKAAAVPEEEEAPPEPAEPEEPELPAEDVVTELETGLKLLLRPHDVKEIWSLAPNVLKQESRIVELLGLEQAFPIPNQRSVVSEFHVFNLMHAKSLCMGALQGAAFHAIMARMLDMMKISEAAQPVKPQDVCGVGPCFKEFERLLLQHSVDDPPERLAVFQASEARQLTEFAAGTFFKHFLLYQFCTNFGQEGQLLRRSLGVMGPQPPPDLNLAQLRPPEVPAGEEGEGRASDREEQEQPTEEEEVERIVQEKLREAEERLQRKLDDREEMLKEKAAERVAAAKPKGKKK